MLLHTLLDYNSLDHASKALNSTHEQLLILTSPIKKVTVYFTDESNYARTVDIVKQ